MSKTITYDEGAKGWTSFHSFIPDWMDSLNNRFFSVKDGQLYLHNDEENPTRNNFYGVQYDTSITFIMNEEPSLIKVAKTLNTESNKPFTATIKSYINDEETSVTESKIDVSEFVNKEGKWYGYTRRNELSGDNTAKDIYGIGRLDTIVGSTITTLTPVPTTLISAGDLLVDSNGTPLGIIISYEGNQIIIDDTPTITQNTFLAGRKNSRIEGSAIRGYNFEVTLLDETTSRTELFAVSSEVFKSEPS